MEAAEDEVATIEEVSVFSLLFPQGKGSSLHEEYLFSLTAASLEQLTQEPVKLGDQTEKIKRQMQDLAFANYKSFVDTSGCMHDMKSRIHHTRKDVGSLLQDLPALSQSCEQFCKRAGAEINPWRAINQLTLEHHSELLDLLEIPELMDTYVRGEFYDEALQLEAFAQTLKKKHPDVALIQNIVEDVRRSTELMLSQLHSKLRDNIQLPVCLRVISHLRRLRVYNETQLRVSFLKSRDAWLKKAIQSVPTTNSYTYLSKLIDSCRVNLFDVITQYRAIFADDTSNQEESKGVGILYAWLVQKVSDFLSILQEYLPKLKEGSLLANILEQCMYYGMSLGRVGVDFRALLPPLFEGCIIDMFSSLLDAASQSFSEALRAQRWVAPPKALSAAMMTGIETGEAVANVPPMVLLDHPPLAIFTNSILTAFNELRQCAPYSLKRKLTVRLKECLSNGVQQIKTLREELTLEDSQEKYFESMCKVGAEVFLPYIVRCFSSLYESPFSLIDAAPLVEVLREIYDKEKDAGEGALNKPSPALFDLLLDDEEEKGSEKGKDEEEVKQPEEQKQEEPKPSEEKPVTEEERGEVPPSEPTKSEEVDALETNNHNSTDEKGEEKASEMKEKREGELLVHENGNLENGIGEKVKQADLKIEHLGVGEHEGGESVPVQTNGQHSEDEKGIKVKSVVTDEEF